MARLLRGSQGNGAFSQLAWNWESIILTPDSYPNHGGNRLNITASLASHGLYAITNGPRADLLDAVAQALAGGASLLQYLDEETDHERRHAESTAILRLCRQHGVPMMIHEDVALAHAIGADGVHVGGCAEDLARARAKLGPRAIIGVACRDSLDHARTAVRGGASYVSFGAFFASPTKPLAPRASIDLLRQSASLGVPRVAIGGITADNGKLLVEAGAEYLASISSVFGAADIRHAARRLADLYVQPPEN
ncbi:MAG TPA: thiamine phosphate synthase [Rhodanobacter sp.]|nr:thiamine phosphate synthase [Rhodanobacter sp.]